MFIVFCCSSRLLFFFFFKQKTAYEMRISDWSSDVCSSDLTNSFVDNVGATRSLGAETTIRWLTPLKGLSIEQSASYIEARTTEPFQDVSGTVVPEDTLMPSSPRVQSVTTLRFKQPIRHSLTPTPLLNTFPPKSRDDTTT